jgi:hypothetical protein
VKPAPGNIFDIAKQLQNVIFNERKKELGKLWKF